MTDEEMRAALAEVIASGLRIRQPVETIADALLPVVRKIADQRATEVLRAAAQEQRNEADQVPDTDEGTHADGHRCAATFLDRRAVALDPA